MCSSTSKSWSGDLTVQFHLLLFIGNSLFSARLSHGRIQSSINLGNTNATPLSLIYFRLFPLENPDCKVGNIPLYDPLIAGGIKRELSLCVWKTNQPNKPSPNQPTKNLNPKQNKKENTLWFKAVREWISEQRTWRCRSSRAAQFPPLPGPQLCEPVALRSLGHRCSSCQDGLSRGRLFNLLSLRICNPLIPPQLNVCCCRIMSIHCFLKKKKRLCIVLLSVIHLKFITSAYLRKKLRWIGFGYFVLIFFFFLLRFSRDLKYWEKINSVWIYIRKVQKKFPMCTAPLRIKILCRNK